MQFEYKTKKVSFSQITKEGETYRITTQTSVEPLLPSVKTLGILRPPVLRETDPSKYNIIAGHRRMAAAIESGWTEITAKILAHDTDELQCLLVAIGDNSLERTLNQIELSRAFTQLTRHIHGTDDIRHYAGVLNLPYNPAYYKKMIAIGRLTESIQEGILNGHIALPTALLFEKMNPKGAKLFSDLFRRFKFSLNKQREIIELATEISIREEISVVDVLRSKLMLETMSNPKLEPSQITQKIRTYLKARRFPYLTNAENHFSQMVSHLSLKPGLTLTPPSNFEGSQFTLSISFKDPDDLAAYQSAISELLKKPTFTEYFQTS